MSYRELNYKELYYKTLKEKAELEVLYNLQLMQDKEKIEKSISKNGYIPRELIIFFLFGLSTIIGLVFIHKCDK